MPLALKGIARRSFHPRPENHQRIGITARDLSSSVARKMFRQVDAAIGTLREPEAIFRLANGAKHEL
jgi:hypothetical protein